MHLKGTVLLNDDPVGSFELDPDEKIIITFNKGAAGVAETLEFASEQGLILGLQYQPAYGPKD